MRTVTVTQTECSRLFSHTAFPEYLYNLPNIAACLVRVARSYLNSLGPRSVPGTKTNTHSYLILIYGDPHLA